MCSYWGYSNYLLSQDTKICPTPGRLVQICVKCSQPSSDICPFCFRFTIKKWVFYSVCHFSWVDKEHWIRWKHFVQIWTTQVHFLHMQSQTFNFQSIPFIGMYSSYFLIFLILIASQTVFFETFFYTFIVYHHSNMHYTKDMSSCKAVGKTKHFWMIELKMIQLSFSFLTLKFNDKLAISEFIQQWWC